MSIMAKKAAPKKAKKRGRPEQRLVITEDPEKALARLLKVPPKK
jgi:hypothetical protein